MQLADTCRPRTDGINNELIIVDAFWQSESKVRNLCIFGLVFGKQNTLKTRKIAWHMDKEIAPLEQAAVLYLSSILQYFINKSVLLFAVAIWPVTGQDLKNTK